MTYHVGRGTEQLGQFSEEEIRSGLTTGRFLETDLVWRDGMSGWQPLGETLPPIESEAPVAPVPYSDTNNDGLGSESAQPLSSGQNDTPAASSFEDVLPSRTTITPEGTFSFPSSGPHAGLGVMPVPGSAIASLVLGLVPVLFCIVAPITGIIGVVLGHSALAKMKVPGTRYEGKGLALAGVILNYVWLALTLLAIIFFVIVFVFGAAASNMETTPTTTM